MNVDDIQFAVDVVLSGGWGDRRDWFTFAASHPGCVPFVAELDGEIVGAAVATINGNAGWVGTVFVAVAARGRGIGGALTDATIEALEDAGCRTLVLVATDEGRPIYERRGFELDTTYHFVEAAGTRTGGGRLRPFRADDLGSMAELDRLATGEDREHLLRAFASETSAWCLSDDDRLRGFVVRAPWGGGATVAPDLEDGLTILEARRARIPPEKTVRAGLLAANGEGLDRLRTLGWSEGRKPPRLIRGEPLDWRPEWLWGQFNFAMG
jgi:GNAT superfamily N-acetyltransferase